MNQILEPHSEPALVKSLNGGKGDLPLSSSGESELFELEKYPLLDYQKGLEIIGREAYLREMLQMLVKESIPSDLEHLKIHYAEKNWNKIEYFADKLRDGALYCGTVRMSYACGYLEHYHRTGQTALLERLYHQCISVLEETLLHVEEHLR